MGPKRAPKDVRAFLDQSAQTSSKNNKHRHRGENDDDDDDENENVKAVADSRRHKSHKIYHNRKHSRRDRKRDDTSEEEEDEDDESESSSAESGSDDSGSSSDDADDDSEEDDSDESHSSSESEEVSSSEDEKVVSRKSKKSQHLSSKHTSAAASKSKSKVQHLSTPASSKDKNKSKAHSQAESKKVDSTSPVVQATHASQKSGTSSVVAQNLPLNDGDDDDGGNAFTEDVPIRTRTKFSNIHLNDDDDDDEDDGVDNTTGNAESLAKTSNNGGDLGSSQTSSTKHETIASISSTTTTCAPAKVSIDLQNLPDSLQSNSSLSTPSKRSVGSLGDATSPTIHLAPVSEAAKASTRTESQPSNESKLQDNRTTIHGLWKTHHEKLGKRKRSESGSDEEEKVHNNNNNEVDDAPAAKRARTTTELSKEMNASDNEPIGSEKKVAKKPGRPRTKPDADSPKKPRAHKNHSKASRSERPATEEGDWEGPDDAPPNDLSDFEAPSSKAPKKRGGRRKKVEPSAEEGTGDATESVEPKRPRGRAPAMPSEHKAALAAADHLHRSIKSVLQKVQAHVPWISPEDYRSFHSAGEKSLENRTQWTTEEIKEFQHACFTNAKTVQDYHSIHRAEMLGILFAIANTPPDSLAMLFKEWNGASTTPHVIFRSAYRSGLIGTIDPALQIGSDKKQTLCPEEM